MQAKAQTPATTPSPAPAAPGPQPLDLQALLQVSGGAGRSPAAPAGSVGTNGWSWH
jgi:hypothetical protein